MVSWNGLHNQTIFRMKSRPLSDQRLVAGALLNLLEESSTLPAALSSRVSRAIRMAILNGTLRQGARLPSTRALAADLSVSRSTAETAYARLEDEGFLLRSVGDGTYVNAVPMRAASLREMIDHHGALSSRGRRIDAMGACADPRETRAFSAGMPALDSFPLPVWQRLLARRMRQDGDRLLHYSDQQGLPALREAIASYLALSRGVDCDAGQVIVLTSSQQALVLVATMLLDASDSVWMEDPGYRGAQTAFSAAGARLVPVPVDVDGICIDHALSLAPGARMAYLTPSHQYPLGMTLSLERRLRLIEWARRDQSWIVEDDYDSEFHYDSRPVAAIHGLDRHERVLYIGTFSKVMFPGLRIAYLVAPRALVKALVAGRSQIDGHTSPLMQAVLADFMQEGHFMAHLRRMRELYRARRDIFMDELHGKLGKMLLPQKTAGGLQTACLLEHSLNGHADADLAARASKAGIDLPLLSSLYLDKNRQQGFVMGFSALAPAAIHEGMRRLAPILRSGRRR
jgi:GntR family transcriptional regulator / MocR family aminotransferase